MHTKVKAHTRGGVKVKAHSRSTTKARPRAGAEFMRTKRLKQMASEIPNLHERISQKPVGSFKVIQKHQGKHIKKMLQHEQNIGGWSDRQGKGNRTQRKHAKQ